MINLEPRRYIVMVMWKGIIMAEKVLDLSTLKSEKFFVNIPLQMTDISFTITDLSGEALIGVNIEVNPNIYGRISVVGNRVTIYAIPTSLLYDIELSWTSPIYGTMGTAWISATPEELKDRTIRLPVGVSHRLRS